MEDSIMEISKARYDRMLPLYETDLHERLALRRDVRDAVVYQCRQALDTALNTHSEFFQTHRVTRRSMDGSAIYHWAETISKVSPVIGIYFRVVTGSPRNRELVCDKLMLFPAPAPVCGPIDAMAYTKELSPIFLQMIQTMYRTKAIVMHTPAGYQPYVEHRNSILAEVVYEPCFLTKKIYRGRLNKYLEEAGYTLMSDEEADARTQDMFTLAHLRKDHFVTHKNEQLYCTVCKTAVPSKVEAAIAVRK
jgi:hypothetical protein